MDAQTKKRKSDLYHEPINILDEMTLQEKLVLT